jgi:hypothetical protein
VMNIQAAGHLRLAIVGATGMVGGYALRYALDLPAVERVTSISRRKTGNFAFKLKIAITRSARLPMGTVVSGGIPYCDPEGNILRDASYQDLRNSSTVFHEVFFDMRRSMLLSWWATQSSPIVAYPSTTADRRAFIKN